MNAARIGNLAAQMSDHVMPVVEELLAKAWDEGFKAGNKNPGFEDATNPYRKGMTR